MASQPVGKHRKGQSDAVEHGQLGVIGDQQRSTKQGGWKRKSADHRTSDVEPDEMVTTGPGTVGWESKTSDGIGTSV